MAATQGADPLWAAVSDALDPVRHLEDAWEQKKLERRIREYFRKAAKGLEFHIKPWHVLVREYADCVFASLFQALGDRDWLPRVDFLLVLDAGVRDSFPARALAQVARMDLERVILASHDRAFEEQRYLPMLWEQIQRVVPKGGRSGKKVYDAFVWGRCMAVQAYGQEQDPNQVKAFVSKWADASIAHLSKNTLGDPVSVLTEVDATRLLHALLERGALPIPLVTEHGPPPSRWPFTDYAVHMAYVAHAGPEAQQRRVPKLRPSTRSHSVEAQEPCDTEPGVADVGVASPAVGATMTELTVPTGASDVLSVEELARRSAWTAEGEVAGKRIKLEP